MKRDWLLYLVIFSLALNLGTIGALAYFKWQDRQEPLASPPPAGPRDLKGEPPLPFRELLEKLQLDASQQQSIGRLVRENRPKLMEMRRALAARRAALFALLKEEQLPSWEKVQAGIREINELQMRLEEEMLRHLLEVQKELRPEQRQVLLTQLEQRLSRFWGRGRLHGGGMGPRRMQGPPPEPLCPPEAPCEK